MREPLLVALEAAWVVGVSARGRRGLVRGAAAASRLRLRRGRDGVAAAGEDAVAVPAAEVVAVPALAQRARVLAREDELVAGAAPRAKALSVVALAVDAPVQHAVGQVNLGQQTKVIENFRQWSCMGLCFTSSSSHVEQVKQEGCQAAWRPICGESRP